MTKTDRGEALETFILLSLPRYKSYEQRIKRAEDMKPVEPAAEKTPELLTPSEDIPPPIKIAKPDESSNEVKTAESKPSQPRKGKNLAKSYRQNQIRKLLHVISNVNGSKEIVQLPNLEELINNALSQGRRSLANEEAFYDFLFHNNLSQYVVNRHQIAKWYKNAWYHI